MRSLAVPAFAALVSLAPLAHADEFTLTLGPYGPIPVPPVPQATLNAQSDGDGIYTIQSIVGPGFSLLPVDTPPFKNDNIIFSYEFLAGTYVADYGGFAFSVELDGTLEDFLAFGAGPPYGQQVAEIPAGSSTGTADAYYYSVTAGPAPGGTDTAMTPEPSGFVLLGTGVLGMAGVLRKRLRGRA